MIMYYITKPEQSVFLTTSKIKLDKCRDIGISKLVIIPRQILDVSAYMRGTQPALI